MPWLKVDDGEWCAPWVMIVGPTAYGVYVRLAGFCAQHLTDGLVPGEVVKMIVAAAGDHGLDAIDKLEGVGRVAWHGINGQTTGSLHLPYFLDGNPTAAQVASDREARREKASKAANARWRKT